MTSIFVLSKSYFLHSTAQNHESSCCSGSFGVWEFPLSPCFSQITHIMWVQWIGCGRSDMRFYACMAMSLLCAIHSVGPELWKLCFVVICVSECVPRLAVHVAPISTNQFQGQEISGRTCHFVCYEAMFGSSNSKSPSVCSPLSCYHGRDNVAYRSPERYVVQAKSIVIPQS